jgi:hypothetical protein
MTRQWHSAWPIRSLPGLKGTRKEVVIKLNAAVLAAGSAFTLRLVRPPRYLLANDLHLNCVERGAKTEPPIRTKTNGFQSMSSGRFDLTFGAKQTWRSGGFDLLGRD